MIEKAVCNASPLIFLAKINKLNLLEGYTLYVPAQVRAEIQKGFVSKVYKKHLAAKVHGFSNKGNNADDHSAVNVSGTKNILDECIRSGIKQFVYFSSVKAMAEERGNNQRTDRSNGKGSLSLRDKK